MSPGFGPEAPFRLPACVGQDDAPLSQTVRNFLGGVKPGGIDERNREHIEHKPLQGRARSVRGGHDSTLEIGGVEKHQWRIETQKGQTGYGRGLGVTLNRMKAWQALDFSEDLDLWV